MRIPRPKLGLSLAGLYLAAASLSVVLVVVGGILPMLVVAMPWVAVFMESYEYVAQTYFDEFGIPGLLLLVFWLISVALNALTLYFAGLFMQCIIIPRKKVLATVSLSTLLFLIIGGLKICYWGSEYASYVSPDGQHKIVLDSVASVSQLGMAMPGQSSDYIDGYVRLYDARGTKLNERFVRGLKFIEPHWTETTVYFMGDEFEWHLPSS